MKKIIKIVISIALIAIMCIIATSCNDNITPNDGDKTPIKYTVMTPDGAPSMAIAKMMKDNVSFGNDPIYTIIGSDAVASSFTNGDADFIIAPTNAGINMSNKLGTYQMVAVTSWGNLYLVGNAGTKALSECEDANEFLAQLSGKAVASIGTNLVPDITFKHILSTAGVEATVNASTADLIQNDLMEGTLSYGLLGEPAVTATLMKVSSAKRLCSISELWVSITNTEFTQAGLFVKRSIIENDKESVEKFITELRASIEYLNASAENAKALGDYMESTGKSTLKGAVVSKCYLQMNQKFVLASEVKDDILAFVNVLDVNVSADADIFYQAE